MYHTTILNQKMFAQASAVLTTQNHTPGVTRRLANFHPSIWGDRFLCRPSESTEINGNMEKQVEGLKEEVKTMMIAAAGNQSQILELIDVIQRLGLSYHFEIEIDQALHGLLKTHSDKDSDDLYTSALRFRLLRQQGFRVPCEIFNNFMDDKWHLKEHLTNDVQAMLSLYEATHLRVHGEEILEELLAFTTTYLESMVSHLSPPLSAQVSLALSHPIRKSLPRIQARHFFSIYREDASHNEGLLALGKLDFNRLQKLHQKELSDISRWWKDLDFATKLPFARDRVVESYVWMLGAYFEPQYSLARNMLAKVVGISSIIDDIYDAYGTFEELIVFTNAIERWDIGCLDMLPEYMKLCYATLLDIYEEIESELKKHGRTHLVPYAKEEMKKLVRAYLKENKWLNKDYIPTVDEYLGVALESCAYYLLVSTSFLGMGNIVTKDALDWVANRPKIIGAASTICRLMDDIVSHEFEQKRGHVASSVESYMKQHGVTEQEACDALNKQVEDAWKDLNEEWLRPNNMPLPLLTRVLNFARVIDLLYREGDEYTHVGKVMKSCVASLFINPVSM